MSGAKPDSEIKISIHTLRMEGDVLPAGSGNRQHMDFNPHPPHGG